MSFKRHDLQTTEDAVKSSQASVGDGGRDNKTHNIKSIKLPPKTEMRTVDPPDLRREGRLNYIEVRKRFLSGDQASSRFVLNDLSRKLMSVEEEESRRIESEVQRRMKIVFENLHKKVEEQAYSEGYNAGKEEGKRTVIEELTPSIQQFDALLKSFEEASHDIYVANEDLIFRLLSQIMKKILIKEVSLDKDYVRRATIGILTRIGTKDNIKVYVNPELISESEMIKEGLGQALGTLRNISIEPDATIRSGCIVETEFGTIDSTIDTQIENLDHTIKTGEAT